MVRLVIPVESFDGERSQIFELLGRAPEFVVVDISDDGRVAPLTFERNMSEHFGGHEVAGNLVIRIGPDALVVKGMGPKGLSAFDSSGIAVFAGPVTSVSEAIEAYAGHGSASGDMKRVEVIAISAGFDAHKEDLASLGLTSDCYSEIGKRLSNLGKKVFGVLEGGYSGENIARDLNELIRALEGRERSKRSG
jgi:predicted Fe-Mo cluster-binding NifX family protein